MCILFYYFIHQHINYKGDYQFNINKVFVVFGIFSYLGNNVGIDDPVIPIHLSRNTTHTLYVTDFHVMK